MSEEKASPDHPIHKPFAERWMPYSFDDRPVPEKEPHSLFEAVRREYPAGRVQ